MAMGDSARASAAEAMMQQLGAAGAGGEAGMPPPDAMPPEAMAPTEGGDIETALMSVDAAAETLPGDQATKVRELTEQIRQVLADTEEVAAPAPEGEEVPPEATEEMPQ